MKQFRYALDPLCLACCALYALNRWILKPHVDSVFLHGYFNDMLLIPCALPIILWMQRKVGLRKTDAPPDLAEILFHLVVWSVLFEAIGPHIMNTTGDIWDVVVYTIGAFVAWVWWNRRELKPALA
ncbi:MAG: hypothetical protein JWO95_863 [Verrucomicrobiales bacterium]|nr:hypothetical protein [Verrucomicrobiales bacterium]